MKIFGYSTLLMSAGIAEVPKSDSNPKKRIQTLGENMKSWTSQHLCFEGRCLKAVTKTDGNWSQRIDRVTQRLTDLYEKCGSIPERDRVRRDTEDENNDVTELMRPRYSKDVPLKGIGQLTGAVRKWSEDYLQQCRSEKKMKNNGIPMISLRMHKWKVILENGYHKVRKDTDSVKPTPSNWAKW